MTTNREILGFDDRLLRLVGIPIIGFLIPVIFFGADLRDGPGAYIPHWLIATFYTTIYWEVDRRIMIITRKRYLKHQNEKRRLLVLCVSVLVFTLSFCNIADYLFGFIESARDQQPSAFEGNAASLVCTITILAIYESMFYFSRYQVSKLEAEKLKRQQVQSELESLKNQVNPHFLFNTLNTLAAIIPEDSNKAVKFVEKLSFIYRYVLEIKEKQLIPLRDELRYLEAYLYLVQIRYDEGLQIGIRIPEEFRDQMIIPLSLQMLVENAIKHNSISAEHPLNIQISINDDERLVVENNLQERMNVMDSTKTGLNNLVNRYRILSEQLVEIVKSASSFSVTLPLIQITDHEGFNH